jgi:hypothetical protein
MPVVSPRPKVFQLQATKDSNQANPVSTTLYTILNTTPNVRIYSAALRIDWAVTQPNPLDLVFTIDGVTKIHTQANPVTATWYRAIRSADSPDNAELFSATLADDKAFLYEGRSVKAQCRVTWAVTQPNPMYWRLKWGKIP